MNTNPIFVVCHPRSGSTLLRYVLDTHPDIYCPPELHLVRLLNILAKINQTLDLKRDGVAADVADSSALVKTAELVNGVMLSACVERAKRIWCEKSVMTVDHLSRVVKAFPEARYIFLYRHPMDFINSALETMQFSWMGNGYEEYVFSRRESPVVDSLAKYWCEKVERSLALEKTGLVKSFRIRYEDIVADLKGSCQKLFGFLGLSYADDLVDNIFKVPHDKGNGDVKILLTSGIEQNSVGQGRRVPCDEIQGPTLEGLNRLLLELGYETVGKDWNSRGATLYGKGEANPLGYIRREMAHIFQEFLPGRLNSIAAVDGYVRCDIRINDLPDEVWRINFAEHTCERSSLSDGNPNWVSMDADTLTKLKGKTINLYTAVRSGQVQLSDFDGMLILVGKVFGYM